MNLTFRKLHPHIGAEVSDIDVREVDDRETLLALRDGMDRHGVLVFRNQRLTDADQLAFAQRWDGTLHAKLGSNTVAANRFGNPALGDISNTNAKGELLKADDRKRVYSLANRLWHTDASFREPAGRYSLLSARVVPPVRADTEFADMRIAWDTLDADTQRMIEGLRAHHSIAWSRQQLGFDFSKDEMDALKGAVQPLVRTNPRTGRRSIYLASHITRILDWPLPEGRLLVADLMAHATQPQFRYTHQWLEHDLVVWDNLATMHRGRAYDDLTHRREMRRVTTLDYEFVPASGMEVLTDSVEV